ncbi:hypothetical protein IWQ60_008147 [Tieghemiomyces parasiticus]|uniref:Uncharacterized protein n=1 Tax=Tieghemiomyces parasiticus TaxID=78921 RepID=A0A9W8DNP6_9FUNG|nr:hypothetical protein IWQ60_008147 [Tieghemiomyces parasiticus]
MPHRAAPSSSSTRALAPSNSVASYYPSAPTSPPITRLGQRPRRLFSLVCRKVTGRPAVRGRSASEGSPLLRTDSYATSVSTVTSASDIPLVTAECSTKEEVPRLSLAGLSASGDVLSLRSPLENLLGDSDYFTQAFATTGHGPAAAVGPVSDPQWPPAQMTPTSPPPYLRSESFASDVTVTSPEPVNAVPVYLGEDPNQLFDMGSNLLLGLNGYPVNLELASIYLEMAHNYEQTDATAVLGFCYEFGLGVATDYRLAEHCYLTAAKSGNGLGMTRMVFLRKFGRPGVVINQPEADRWQQLVNRQGVHALKWLRTAAERVSHPAAQYALGLCYLDGVGFPKHERRAFEYFHRAALSDLDRAQSVLGYCYIEGIGVTKNLGEALNWYRRAADQGETMAIYNLGYCYEYGVGVSRDVNAACHWYRRAAEQGNAFAQNSLGYCYEDGIGLAKDPCEAAVWYRRSAEQGYPWAQCNLGYCYQYGIGLAKDYEQGAQWYLRAAEQGYSRAQHNVGFCYQNGIGIDQCGETAFRWYQASAAKGNIFAFHSLGYCYQYGMGVAVDLRRAVEWYTKAAEKRHAPAQLSLGYCYRNGIGVDVNLVTAYEWFEKAATQGNHLAQNSVGYCFEEGLGVTADPVQAFRWYSASAAQDNAWAQCNVGQCYLLGIGVAQDAARAAEWFTLAAAQDLSRAQQKMGYCYQHGLGVPRDLERAFQFYLRAARQNHAMGILHLATCFEQGIGVARDVSQAIHWLQRGSALGDLTAAERFRELTVRCCLAQLKAELGCDRRVSPIAPCA